MLKYKAKILFYDTKCYFLKWSRQIKGVFQHKKTPVYLFILSPPYCGSTLLNELLCTSSNLSSTNIFGTREGLGLPEVRRLIDYKKHWEDDYLFPWETIKKVWLKYWDNSKSVFLDKSQPALIRAKAMESVFAPAYFILLIRHPYALCESYMRRDKMNAHQAVSFAIRCLEVQRKNSTILGNVFTLKYENLVDNESGICENISEFLPSIGRIRGKQSFKAHNFKNKALPMINLNREKFKNIKPSDKLIIDSVLEKHSELMAFWGYELIKDIKNYV